MLAARTTSNQSTATIDNKNNDGDKNDDDRDDKRDTRWPPVPFINQLITVHRSTHHRSSVNSSPFISQLITVHQLTHQLSVNSSPTPTRRCAYGRWCRCYRLQRQPFPTKREPPAASDWSLLRRLVFIGGVMLGVGVCGGWCVC